VATAGWSIPRSSADRFAGVGTHLQRYARVLNAVEINSSFYRPHTRTTYARWAEATPAAFQFAVKLARTITHEAKLERSAAAIDRFLDETSGLGHKRGPILVQLPPSLAFDSAVAGEFFEYLRGRYDGDLVCEPRHATWTLDEASALLRHYRVARVAADPARSPELAVPGGDPHLVYFRLHGSPRTYWSSYTPDYLEQLAAQLRRSEASPTVWCVFDNTAAGAALSNAWDVHRLAHPDEGR
jgi:uncharacterized protein YecE (DUF72 family)